MSTKDGNELGWGAFQPSHASDIKINQRDANKQIKLNNRIWHKISLLN